MALLDQAGTYLGKFGWESMGNILIVVVIFFSLMVLFTCVFLFMWWKSFNLVVKIYEPIGQVPLSEEELNNIKEETKVGEDKTLKEKEIRFSNIKYKKTHGKFIISKGNPFFRTFSPFRRHEPVPMEFMYDDGIYLLKLSKELFIPFEKPKTTVIIGEQTSISVASDNRWRVWNNMMADRINNKYQDIDAQKKVAFYFVTGIVALVLIGGFILWLIYSSANRGWDAAEQFNQFAGKLLGGDSPQ